MHLPDCFKVPADCKNNDDVIIRYHYVTVRSFLPHCISCQVKIGLIFMLELWQFFPKKRSNQKSRNIKDPCQNLNWSWSDLAVPNFGMCLFNE